MNARRLLSVLVAVVVAGVYFFVVVRNGDRQKQLFAGALAAEGCVGGDVVVVGVDGAKGRVVDTTTYVTSLVTACGAKWEIETASGGGIAARVSKTTKLVP